eukprot:TCONS_00050129-protein
MRLLHFWKAFNIRPRSFQKAIVNDSTNFHRKMATFSSMEAVSGEYKHLNGIFKNVLESSTDNLEFFNQKQKQDFHSSFQNIINVLDPLQMSLGVITNCCSKFDASPTSKGNGYRSIISIIESCLIKIQELSRHIQRSREKIFFRSYHVYMELESYSQVLTRLLTISHLAIVLLDYSDVGNLFPHDCVVDDMMIDFEKINRECFYGRSFGFQYSDSIRQSLHVIAVAMAAYGDGYQQHNHSLTRALSSMLHSGKYMVNPELRAQRINELTQNANIDFCKAFWGLTEEYGVQHAPLLICPAMAVNLEFEIPPQQLGVQTVDKQNEVTVDFPFLNSGYTGIPCRLLSYVLRSGQDSLNKAGSASSSGVSPLGPKPAQKSRYLMIHCHGGGFVAQSSKSHEMYLRYMAKELQIPILSIDYSLAPDAPYPQAVKEVYYAYVWALNNFDKLGTLGEKIVFAGDSAGANIVTAITIQAIKDNIRLPDSIVVAYPPYRLQFLPSPSRILCLMDPLLPVGVLKSCIQAYTGGFKHVASNTNMFTFDPSSYNAFDLDFGEEDNRGFLSKKHLQHSYSETQLNVIKAKYNNEFEESSSFMQENESFCSEFPVYDSEGDILNTESAEDTKSDVAEDDFLYFKSSTAHAQDGGTSDEDKKSTGSASLLQSLSDQVSSKVQGLTTSISGYFLSNLPTSESNKNNNECSSKQTQEQTGVIKNRKKSLELNLDLGNQNSMNKNSTKDNGKSSFTICRECLFRSEQCICHLSPKALRRRAEKYTEHYKFSHHHVLNSPRRVRSSSLTHREHSGKEHSKVHRIRSVTHCNPQEIGLNIDTDEGALCSPTAKDKALQNFRLSLLGSSTETPPASPSTQRTQSSAPSPRVVYDSTTESCVILTPEEEGQVHTEGELGGGGETKDMLGATSKAFNDAKDPLMSPFLADDETLKCMPPITIVASALDPLLDDSVEFVRKLQKLEKPSELYILEKLPHGFLNFQPFSTEAREGCDLIIACVKKSLHMGMRRLDSTQSFGFPAKDSP